jgi:hypothetical protein
MEFDIEKNKVVGIVGQRIIKNDHARIKVIGYLDSKHNCIRPTEDELVKLFPPMGNVFWYNFFTHCNLTEGEFIQFKVQEFEYTSRPEDDKYGINDNSLKCNKFGDRIFEIKDFETIHSTADLRRNCILRC